jgi:hypothetical protein
MYGSPSRAHAVLVKHKQHRVGTITASIWDFIEFRKQND